MRSRKVAAEQSKQRSSINPIKFGDNALALTDRSESAWYAFQAGRGTTDAQHRHRLLFSLSKLWRAHAPLANCAANWRLARKANI